MVGRREAHQTVDRKVKRQLVELARPRQAAKTDSEHRHNKSCEGDEIRSVHGVFSAREHVCLWFASSAIAKGTPDWLGVPSGSTHTRGPAGGVSWQTMSAPIREPLEWTDDNHAYRDQALGTAGCSLNKLNIPLVSLSVSTP
jgi:hypothetical protein